MLNVYDFDGTIYSGDSTIDFYLYALKKKPSLLRFLPKQFLGFALYLLKCIDKTKFKEYYFSFLPAIDAEKTAQEFWKRQENKIYAWYKTNQSPTDIVISASPQFLLQPICTRLCIQNLIASKVDPKTGKFKGENCRGEEKVRRLAEECNIVHIDSFYSDSRSDAPLAAIATKAYFVKKGEIQPWKQ